MDEIWSMSHILGIPENGQKLSGSKTLIMNQSTDITYQCDRHSLHVWYIWSYATVVSPTSSCNEMVQQISNGQKRDNNGDSPQNDERYISQLPSMGSKSRRYEVDLISDLPESEPCRILRGPLFYLHKI